jgi:hypothetical protein
MYGVNFVEVRAAQNAQGTFSRWWTSCVLALEAVEVLRADGVAAIRVEAGPAD